MQTYRVLKTLKRWALANSDFSKSTFIIVALTFTIIHVSKCHETVSYGSPNFVNPLLTGNIFSLQDTGSSGHHRNTGNHQLLN